MKAYSCPAAILDSAGAFQLTGGFAAAVALTPQCPVARDLDFEAVGQGVDHRDTDPV